MSLDDLLKPAKWVDQQVLRQYTKVGKRIPEKHLYKITMGAQMVGKVGTATWGSYIGISSIISGFVSGFVLDGPDFSYNVMGLQGRIRKDSDGEAISIDPMQNFNDRYNRAIRLPVFLTGVGFFGKVVYDFANYFMNGEPLTSDTAMNATTSFGFFSLASSMYLKDADPKLLDKAPFWKTAYDWAKAKVKSLAPEPQPLLQPAPLQSAVTLENYV